MTDRLPYRVQIDFDTRNDPTSVSSLAMRQAKMFEIVVRDLFQNVQRDGPVISIEVKTSQDATDVYAKVNELFLQQGMYAAVCGFHRDANGEWVGNSVASTTPAEGLAIARGDGTIEDAIVFQTKRGWPDWAVAVEFPTVGDARSARHSLNGWNLPARQEGAQILIGAATRDHADRIARLLTGMMGHARAVQVIPGRRFIPLAQTDAS